MLTRQDEVRYHNLTTFNKSLYLVEKYGTPENLPNLYLIYTPNLKELINNLVWRISSDLFLEHYFKGITDPLTKEPAYAVAGLLPSFTAAYFSLNIGSSDNKFTYTHFLYTALRSIGKATPLFLADEEKRTTKGALDHEVKTSLYAMDISLRWITYANERFQSDNNTNVFSPEIILISFVSGWARVYGAEKASPIARKAQYITKTMISYPSSAIMITVFGTNILEETSNFDKVSALLSITQSNINLLTKPALIQLIPYLEQIPTEKLTNLIQPAYMSIKSSAIDGSNNLHIFFDFLFSIVNIYLNAFSNTASFLNTNIAIPITNFISSGASNIITKIPYITPINKYLITPVSEYVIIPINKYTSIYISQYAVRISEITHNTISHC